MRSLTRLHESTTQKKSNRVGLFRARVRRGLGSPGHPEGEVSSCNYCKWKWKVCYECFWREARGGRENPSRTQLNAHSTGQPVGISSAFYKVTAMEATGKTSPSVTRRWFRGSRFTYSVARSRTRFRNRLLPGLPRQGGEEARESRPHGPSGDGMCTKGGSPKGSRNDRCLLGDRRMEIYLRGSPFNWAATSFLT